MDKRFHITITDTKDGTVEVDTDTDCIVGAIHVIQDGMDGSQMLGYIDANGETLAETIFSACKLSKEILRDKPLITVAVLARIKDDTEGGQKNGMDSKGEDGATIMPFPSSRKDEQS